MPTFLDIFHSYLQPYFQPPRIHESFSLWELLAASLILITMVGMFVFLAIVVWAKQRRRERESFYQHELARKVAEHGEMDGERLLAMLQEQSADQYRRRREGLRIGGLVNLAVGIGFFVALVQIEPRTMFLGLIPMFAGVALLVASFLPRPKS